MGRPDPTASSPLPGSNGSATEDQSPKVSEGEQQAEALCTAVLAKSTTKSSARPTGEPYRYRDGLTVQLDDQRTDVVAPYASGAYPGEPTVRATLHLTNTSRADFSTSAVEVKAAYDEKSFAQVGGSGVAEVDDSSTTELPDSIAPGRSGSAALEFLVPQRCANRLIVQVTLDSKHPSARFAGAAS